MGFNSGFKGLKLRTMSVINNNNFRL